MLRHLRKALFVFMIVTVFLVIHQEATPTVQAASLKNSDASQVEILRDPDEADIFSVPGRVIVLRDPDEADIFSVPGDVVVLRDPDEADIFSVPGDVVVLRDPDEADIF